MLEHYLFFSRDALCPSLNAAFQSLQSKVIVDNNRHLNIGQNNQEYDFWPQESHYDYVIMLLVSLVTICDLQQVE